MLDGLEAREPRELRDYQLQAIEDLRQAFRDGSRRCVLQAPTGYGKTVLASNVTRLAREKGHRVIFTVPAIDLVDQTLQQFARDGLTDVGVIQASHRETDWSRPIQIASVQTLARRDRMPDASLVIVDECHRMFDSLNRRLSELTVPAIGLSATPWTKGLGKHWDRLIISATTQDLINLGHLSPFRVFAPSHPDLSGVRTVAGDFHEGELSQAMNKEKLVADVVETWIKRAENRPTLVFGVDRAHAKHLQAKFNEVGISAGYQDAFTKLDERAEIKRRFHAGDYKVVCNVGTLTLGIDWNVHCIVLARPTKSEILYVQIVGRGLRTADGKENLLVLDHSDTTLNLGFVTDIKHDSLDMGKERQKAEKREPQLKPCPECTYLRPPRVRKCPNCGHEAQPPLPLQHQDGELVELTRGRKVSDRHIQLRGRLIPLEEFYGELLAYGISKGYKPGWAFHKFMEATGKRPQRHIGPVPTSFEVLQWIKSRAIAYARRRA